MDFLNDIASARSAINDFLIEQASSLPDDLKAQVRDFAASASPVEQICNMAELLYARQKDAGTAGRKLAAQLAAFGAANGWHFLRDGRGQAIAFAMMRRNNYAPPVGITYQAAADDPDPLKQFVPAAPASDAQPQPIEPQA